MTAARSIYKKDIKVFLILIPLINVLNYYLTYDHISVSWHTGITFTIDTLEGYIAWLVVRRTILFLNGRLNINTNPIRRIIVQLVLTTVCGMLVIIGLTAVTNILGSSKPIPRSFFTLDIFIFLIWFFVVNGIYISWHYYDLWVHTDQLNQNHQEKISELTRVAASGLVVSTGRQTQLIGYEQIAGFLFENDYAFVVTISGEKHVVDGSLDQIEGTLPKAIFFRVNRQLVVSRHLVSSYKKLANGKLTVSFKSIGGFVTEADVSRTKAPAFKQWIQDGYHQDSAAVVKPTNAGYTSTVNLLHLGEKAPNS